MSATVSAVPFLLLYMVAEAGVVSIINFTKNTKENMTAGNINLSKADIDQLINRDFETQFMDKDLLLKTLEEYGAENIECDNDNISCECDDFHVEFYKEPLKPYIMNIRCKDGCEIEEFAKDLGDEYTINVQELSYNKIKQRLEEQNLTIDQEDIQEDNTIVLTVNLE